MDITRTSGRRTYWASLLHSCAGSSPIRPDLQNADSKRKSLRLSGEQKQSIKPNAVPFAVQDPVWSHRLYKHMKPSLGDAQRLANHLPYLPPLLSLQYPTLNIGVNVFLKHRINNAHLLLNTTPCPSQHSPIIRRITLASPLFSSLISFSPAPHPYPRPWATQTWASHVPKQNPSALTSS